MTVRLRITFIAVACAAAILVSSSAGGEGPQVGLVVDEGQTSDGYILFNPSLHRDTYLIDNEGRLVHSWSNDYRGFMTYLQDDGNLLRVALLIHPGEFPGGATGRVERIAWDGSLVWEFQYNEPDYVAHHDIAELPNGNVLILAWERKSAEEAIAAGRDPELLQDGELLPEHIIEVEPTGASGGNVVWEWHVWDHLVQDIDPTKDNYGTIASHPELIDINFIEATRPPGGDSDWTHANSVAYNPDLDQIVISVRHFGELWVIDHSTTTEEAAGHTGGQYGKGGDLLYRWGNPMAYGAGGPEDQQLFSQHDVRWIEPGLPGEGNFLIFNNGNGRGYSSVEEIVPPVDGSGGYQLTTGEAYGPAAPVWTYAAPTPTDFYADFISGSVRLPNGNTLINDGPLGTFFEVTPAGETIWKYVNPITEEGPLSRTEAPGFRGNSVFRAERYVPTYPGLNGKDLTPGEPLELPVPDADKDLLEDADEVAIYGTDPLLQDTDGDGCQDGAEVLRPGELGGERDPLYQWDYYDVATTGMVPVPDGTIDLANDILGVFNHFSPGGEPPYDAHYDRGPTIGEHHWNRAGPDGVIDLTNDILGVLLQVGQDCGVLYD